VTKKVYAGTRDEANNCSVIVLMSTKEKYTLPLRLDLFPHSTTGFNWGYGGSGPSQLALAILADFLGAKIAKNHKPDAVGRRAIELHHRFKRLFIEPLSGDSWKIEEREIKIALLEFENEDKMKKGAR